MHHRGFKFIKVLVLALCLGSVVSAWAQDPPAARTQEVSDLEGIPVLVKHLPDWESKRTTAQFFSDSESFRGFFDQREILKKVEFFPGTEAVYATYDEGKLLIVEYSTPQASVEVDKLIAAVGPGNDYFYRRIGNYNVFLFDPANPANPEGANKLLDQIKYQKVVTWPYGDPTGFFQKERDFIVGAKSLFLNTVLFILVWLAMAIVFGLCLGIFYFRKEDRRRTKLAAFSDAGGLTRLNLDGLSADLTKLIDD